MADEQPVTVERTPSGVCIARAGKTALFFARCEEGCYWTLEPDYRTYTWVAYHGERIGPNGEAVLHFERPYEPTELLGRVAAWVERVHAYETGLG